MDDRRSPEMELEDRGRKIEAHAYSLEDGRKTLSPGKLDQINLGNFVVYAVAGRDKACAIGKTITISDREFSLAVHRYKLVTDNHLRLYWHPFFFLREVELKC